MVDWKDPTVIEQCARIYITNAAILLGAFGIFCILWPDIEWSLITRKRRFSPTLIPYIFGRYAILATLLFFVVTSRFSNKISCDIAYKILAVLGSAASFCSTLNLSIRTYIIWRDMNKIVVWLLSFASFAHAALVIVQGVQSVSSQWDSERESCVVVRSSNITMFTFYLYTAIMDLAILALTICGLWRKAALKSAIGTTLSEQCLWYCAGTLLVNIPAAVFPILNLNVIMNVIASMPATTVSVILSSYAVLGFKPQRRRTADTDNTSPNARNQMRIAMPVRGVTLTTNIVLEPQINSNDVERSLDVTSSEESGRKTTDGAGMV